MDPNAQNPTPTVDPMAGQVPAPVTTPPTEPVATPEPTVPVTPEPQAPAAEQPVVTPTEGTGDTGTGMPPATPPAAV